MEIHDKVNVVPEELTAINSYEFSQIKLKNDFAIGVSHAVKITFELPNA